MKKILKFAFFTLMFLAIPAMSGQRDVFDMKMNLKVPRVYDNT